MCNMLDGFSVLDGFGRFGRFGMNSRIMSEEELWNARCVQL